ncbi:MAG: RNA 2'-phosphotransferase [Chloroflexota bacterium]
MKKINNRKISKFLALILRHDPGRIGLELDPQGWANVDELLEKINRSRKWQLTRDDLENVVAEDNKQRYRLNSDKTQIRASQGHSIQIDLGLEPVEPPAVLYHGTAKRFLNSIMDEGLVSKSRQHVHLSADVKTATTVGKRHGRPAILLINTQQMAADGHQFYLSDNKVWLTDHVPVKYITLLAD